MLISMRMTRHANKMLWSNFRKSALEKVYDLQYICACVRQHIDPSRNIVFWYYMNLMITCLRPNYQDLLLTSVDPKIASFFFTKSLRFNYNKRVQIFRLVPLYLFFCLNLKLILYNSKPQNQMCDWTKDFFLVWKNLDSSFSK